MNPKIGDKISVLSLREEKVRTGTVVRRIRAGELPTKSDLDIYFEVKEGHKHYKTLSTKRAKVDRIVIKQSPPKRYFIFPICAGMEVTIL